MSAWKLPPAAGLVMGVDMQPAGPPAVAPANAHTWFDTVWDGNYQAILAYALRRTDTPDDAADVAAETFLTAWRRAADAPDGEQVRLWLFGIARRVLANQQRGLRRFDRLTQRLRDHTARRADTSPPADGPEGVREAFARLRPADRDLLTLVAVEGLSTAQVAVVHGCSHVAVRVRLHRARARFARELAAYGVTV
ncbi:RNA polymerase sigma factor [Catellatospora aurea]|uniref:RNA polymerase sigma factor n=1 Tax=Catellatospora aurea TaxID=1337874 RepID=A0ABW2H4P4_9ACTN